MADDIKLVVGVDYTELTGLIRTTSETKTAVKALAQDFAKTGNQRQYMSGINKIVSAQKNLKSSSSMSKSEIMKLGAETRRQIKFKEALANATKSATRAEKNFIQSQMAATKESKNFGVVTQQAGYQVSDFIVQIQSGTNGFVAFGQQASQLVGVLPLVASKIGLTTGAAIGLSASLGIIIPIITMVGAALTRTGSEAKTFSDAIGEAESALNDYEDALDNVLNKDLDQEFGSKVELIRNIEEATLDLSLALGKIEISNAFAKLTEDVDASLTATQKFLRGMAKSGANILDVATFGLGGYTTSAGKMFTGQKALDELGLGDIVKEQEITNLQALFKTGQFTSALIEIEKIFDRIKASEKTLGVDAISFLLNLKDTAQVASDLQGKLDGSAEKAKKRAEFEKDILDTGKMIDGLLKDANKEIDKTLDLEEEKLQLFNEAYNKQNTINKLLAEEQKYGKDSTEYKILQASLEDEKLKKGIDSLKISETQKNILKDLVDEQRNLLNGLDKEEEKRKRIANLIISPSLASKGAGYAALSGELALRQATGLGVVEDKKGTGTKGGKRPAKSMASIIEGMEKQANLQRKLIGLSDQEADYLQILYNLKEKNKDASGKMTEAQLKQAAERIAAINAETAAMEAQMQKIQDVADSFETHFGDALMGIVTDFDILNGSIEDFGYNAEQVFKNMAREIIKDLYRIFVVKKITGFISSAITGTYNDLGNVGVGGYDGGGYTGSGPRSGGLDGKGGFLAMLHPRETVIDHTKGQSAGSVTVVQNINVSTGVQQTVRTEIKSLMPQIAESAKAAVVDAKRRGGSYGRNFA